MATKPKRPQYVSPKGTFKYPSLSKPDYGTEDYPKPDGEFKTAVIMSAADAQPLIQTLEPLWNEAIALGHAAFAKLGPAIRKKLGSLKEQPFYEEEYAGDEGEEQPTGNVIFKFKTKYKIVDKKTGEVRFNKIGLFDANGDPLKAGTLIYGGTVGKISFSTRDYFIAGQGMAGLSLMLAGAQVISLVGPGARSASSMGFGKEDGYEEVSDAEEEAAAGVPANGKPEDF